jgi:putative flippase GtrA
MKEESLIKRVWRKAVTKETISYVIVGVLTTAVNLVAFNFLCKLDWNALIAYDDWNWNVLIANVIAWFLAVTFAYITNNLFVFGNGIEEKTKEISKWGSGRLPPLSV